MILMNTRKMVIEILGKEWPLSSKKIHNLIKKKYKKSITYHTVYEIIQDLVSKEVLIKNNRAYLLNLNWVNEELNKLTKVKDSYDKNKPIKFLTKKTSQVTVYSLSELFDFILRNMKSNFFSSENKQYFMKCRHPWGSFYSKEEKQILMDSFKNGAYVICQSNLFLDRAIAGFYKKLNVEIKLGADIIVEHETIVIGDCIIQIYYPPKFKKFIAKIFDKGKMSLIKFRKLKQIFEESNEINIVITRNKAIADQIKKEIKSYF